MSRGGAGRGAWEGRELTLGTCGCRRGGVPVEDEQGSGGKLRKSRGRTWRSRGGAEEEQDRRKEEQDRRGATRRGAGEEIGGAGEVKMRRRGGAGPARRSPDDEDRRRGRPNPTRGRVNGAALPSIPPAPPFRGRAGNPPAPRFGAPNLPRSRSRPPMRRLARLRAAQLRFRAAQRLEARLWP